MNPPMEAQRGEPAVSFSIVVPVRNMERTIGRTLNSIVSQIHPADEIIVVDGQSTDGTMKQLLRYREQINQIISEPDEGLDDAINKGIGLATCDVIGILNGDDYYCSTEVLTLYRKRFAGKTPGIIFGDVEFFDADNPEKIIRRYSSKKFRPSRLRYGWMPPHPSVFVRREIYDQVGLYQTNYRIAADYEFLIRALINHEVPYDRIDQVVVRMQYGGMSTSGLKATYRLNKEIIRACRENGLSTNWLYIASKFPRKILEFLPRNA